MPRLDLGKPAPIRLRLAYRSAHNYDQVEDVADCQKHLPFESRKTYTDEYAHWYAR